MRQHVKFSFGVNVTVMCIAVVRIQVLDLSRLDFLTFVTQLNHRPSEGAFIYLLNMMKYILL
jgi:hypothetical protein